MADDIVLEVGVKAFITQADKYLLLLRSKPYPGRKDVMWDLPGGRIHPGEATLDALKREIEEETTLKLDEVISVLAVQDILRVEGKHTVRITYLVSCKDPASINLDVAEHSDYKWLTLQEIKNINHDLYLDPVIDILSPS